MWPSLRRKVWLLVVVVTVASCGAGSTGEATADTSPTASTSTTSTSTTTTSTTTTTLPTATTEELWLTSVREIESSVIEADLGWVPWTAAYSDPDLASLQLEWCSTASSVGDIHIENAPGWLSEHPVVEDIEVLLTDSGAVSQDQLNYSTEVLLPQMLMQGLCRELQPSYSQEMLLSVYEKEALAVLNDNIAVVPSEPEGEIFEDIRSSAFATCTNIDNRTPGSIGVMLMENVFGSDESVSALMAIASMRTAASYLCPGRSGEAISQWADDGYPRS